MNLICPSTIYIGVLNDNWNVRFRALICQADLIFSSLEIYKTVHLKLFLKALVPTPWDWASIKIYLCHYPIKLRMSESQSRLSDTDMHCTPVLYRCAKGVLTQVVRHAFPLPPPCLVAVLPHLPPLALHGSVRGAQSHPLRASCSPPFPSSFIICHFCSLKRSYSSEH